MHTKGNWEVDDRGMAGGVRFSGYVHCDDATGSAVALTRFQFVARSEEETLANARLIAAAPDLLEVAKRLAALDHGKNNGRSFPSIEDCEAARAAIARATGASV